MENTTEKVLEGHLKTVKINDFRCVEEITLDMGEIVALRGNNESGKTSIIKAIELLILGGTNAGKYVRSGCRDFRIAGYVDGIDKTVVRTAKGYKIYDGNVVEKSAEKGVKPITVIDKLKGNETPEPVAKIFNVQRNSVTGNMLGSRGYNGLIPFVQTSDAQNYSIVSEEMGVKPFRDASYGGMLEASRLEKKAKLLSGQITDLKAQQVRAKDMVTKAENMEDLLGDNSALYEAVIGALTNLAKIEEITAQMDGKPVGEAPQEIDVMLLDAIERVKACASARKNAQATLDALGPQKDAPSPIDIDLLTSVTAVKNMAKRRKESQANLAECEEELAKVQNEIKQYGNEINICPVCGAVLVDGRGTE